MLSKTQHYLTQSSLYHPHTILQNMFFFIFVAIAIAVFCAQLVKQLFLYINKEVAGAFRGIAYFLNHILCAQFCFFEKIACGHLFRYKLIKMFCIYVQTYEISMKSFLIPFSSYFLQYSLKVICISQVLAVFCVKRVLTNFARLT